MNRVHKVREMRRRNSRKAYRVTALTAVMALAAALALAACGGGSAPGGAGSAPARSERVVPTMPAAQFAMPTSQISAAAGTTVTTTEEVATPEPADEATEDLARGERVYTNRGCAECHGAEGEGVADKGAAVAGTALSEEEFTDLMRTGGDIGPDHLYGPNAISPSGMTAMYAWLKSLAAE